MPRCTGTSNSLQPPLCGNNSSYWPYDDSGGGGYSDDDGPAGSEGEWGGMDAAGGFGDDASLLSGAATELLSVPRRVEKVEVNYSRAAKQVRLKTLGPEGCCGEVTAAW